MGFTGWARARSWTRTRELLERFSLSDVGCIPVIKLWGRNIGADARSSKGLPTSLEPPSTVGRTVGHPQAVS